METSARDKARGTTQQIPNSPGGTTEAFYFQFQISGKEWAPVSAVSRRYANLGAGFPIGRNLVAVGTFERIGNRRSGRHFDRRTGNWRSGFHGTVAASGGVSAEASGTGALPQGIAAWI